MHSYLRNAAKIRNRNNQVPHPTQDTTWKSDKTQLNITNKSQESSPFPAGDHKAAIKRHKSMTNTRPGPEVKKLFFMLNSTEHGISTAHKS